MEERNRYHSVLSIVQMYNNKFTYSQVSKVYSLCFQNTAATCRQLDQLQKEKKNV